MPSFALVVSLTFAAGAAQTPLADPYAATAPGWSYCSEPNDAEKTCDTISTYQPIGDHTYDEHVVAALSLTDYLIEYDRRISVVDGMDCAPAAFSVMTNIRYRRGERYLEGREAAVAEQALRRQFAGAGNVRICSTVSGEGNNLVATAQVFGEASRGYRVLLRSLQTPLRWIHADDGYTVRTWSALRS